MRKIVVAIALLCLFVGSALAQNESNLPHIANGQFSGGSIRTTFIVFNNGSSTATATILLRDDPGAPLTVTIPGEGTNSTFMVTLEPGEIRFLQTDGMGDVVQGSAVVTSTAPVQVSAIFSIFDPSGAFLTEAGIAASESLTEMALAVDSTGTFSTGIAIQGLGVAADLTFTLFDAAGTQMGTASRSVAANGHLAEFIAQLFPGVTGFRGKLVIAATAPVAALSLRQNSTPLSFTTLPVVSTSSNQLSFLLPQIADGGNAIQTTFVFFNLSNEAATVTLDLTDDDAMPLEVTIPGSGTDSSFTFQIPACGVVFAQTDAQNATALAGAARVVSTQPIGASAIFTILDPQGGFATETGIGDSPELMEFTIPVDTTGTFNTGVAFFNAGTSAVTIEVEVLDQTAAGNGLTPRGSTQTLMLGPGEHDAQFVPELVPGATGLQTVMTARANGLVSALTLRQNTSPLSFTTVPVGEGVPRDGGVAPGGPAVLPRQEMAGSITQDRTIDAVLEGGFTISGTTGAGITLPNGSAAGVPLPTFLISSARAIRDDGEVFSGTADFFGNYSINVPPGSYTLSFCLTAFDISIAGPSGGGAISTTDYRHPSTVVVTNADVTENVLVTSPDRTMISGTVQGLGAIPSGDGTLGTIPELSGATLALSSVESATVAIGTIDQDGSFELDAPPGNYTASVLFAQGELFGPQGPTISDLQGGILFDIGSVQVGGSPVTGVNLVVPSLTLLSGTVTRLDGEPLGDQTGLFMSDRAIPENVRELCFPILGSAFALIMSANSMGMYSDLPLVSGRTFEVRASTPVEGTGAEDPGMLVAGPMSVPIAGIGGSPAGGTQVVNVTFPVPSDSVTLSGRVTDSSGDPLRGVSVSVFTQQLTGLGQGPAFSATTDTNANGEYTLRILSGASYLVSFDPPLQTGGFPGFPTGQ